MGVKTRFVELRNKMAIDPKSAERERHKPEKHKKESLIIDNWTCQSASGTYDGATTYVSSCYFQNENTGQQYAAATINNDDPVPGAWNATNFPQLPGQNTYDLYAVPNDDPQHPDVVYGIYCD